MRRYLPPIAILCLLWPRSSIGHSPDIALDLRASDAGAAATPDGGTSDAPAADGGLAVDAVASVADGQIVDDFELSEQGGCQLAAVTSPNLGSLLLVLLAAFLCWRRKTALVHEIREHRLSRGLSSGEFAVSQTSNGKPALVGWGAIALCWVLLAVSCTSRHNPSLPDGGEPDVGLESGVVADMSVDQGVDLGVDQRVDTGLDQGADLGSDQGADLGSDQGATPPPSIAYEDIPRRVAEIYCAKANQCPTRSTSRTIRFHAMGLESAECVEQGEQLARTRWRQWRDLKVSIERRTTTYDGVSLARCLSRHSVDCRLAQQEFPDWTLWLEICPEAFSGSVGVEGGCWRHEECQSGLYCDHGDDGSSCPGTCKPRLAVGEACSVSGGREFSACQQTVDDGLARCMRNNNQTVCTAIRFAKTAELGQSCGVTEEAGRRTHTLCATGLYCSRANRCVEPIAPGGACDLGLDACQSGDVCLGEAGCSDLSYRAEAGQACGNLVTCSIAQPRLQCVAGYCQAVGDGTLGASCRSQVGNAVQFACNAPLVCDVETKRCDRPKVAGQRCTLDAECASLQCNRATGVCLARVCR